MCVCVYVRTHNIQHTCNYIYIYIYIYIYNYACVLYVMCVRVVVCVRVAVSVRVVCMCTSLFLKRNRCHGFRPIHL